MILPVQIAKEPISTKGPRLSSDLSIAGRYIVLVPFSNVISISKKIKSNTERNRLKKIIERSISFVEPFFTIRNGEIHHKVRIDKKINFKVYFYGENITEEDKKIATRFVEANMNNLNTNYPEIYFYNDYKEINI